MKIIVFGATGSIGTHLIKQALQQGHLVTAFTRDPNQLSALSSVNLIKVQGDVLNPDEVTKALKDQEAVLIALGSGKSRTGKVRSEGTANILQAMSNQGIQRLICQTTLGCGESKNNLNFFWKHIMFGWFLKDVFIDHELQEQKIKSSTLQWTIVRPAAFTDDDLTGNYQHGFDSYDRSVKLKISRADVAHFMLCQLTSSRYLLSTPGLSY